ncbi:MAG: hypothetical protein RMM53_00215 [Bacteroidia bacterium]|nr:hypothetical protein [Bacteroidia bacterium]MDW8332618.1 hypothetical protein [Bacteroidia bacterium]
MSLTSLLEDPVLREAMARRFPMPAVRLSGNLAAPPITSDYARVGMACDYLLRFAIERAFPHKIRKRDHWAAEIGFAMLISAFDRRPMNEPSDKNFVRSLGIRLQSAKQCYERYLDDGVLTDELIESALFLARLETVFRAGVFDFRETSRARIKSNTADLRAILATADLSLFEAKQWCYLNPDFGGASTLVGGADADLIVDDTLVEIKTTRRLRVERSYLNQLLGYCILALVGGVNGEKPGPEIRRIGIYFARHGVMWNASLDEFATRKDFLEFKDRFVEYVARRQAPERK